MSKEFKVVIIDDNESLSYIIRDNINQTEKFDVVGLAHNGEDGIELIHKVNPDLVILDMIMPKADGLTVLETFSNKKGTEFIILSAIGHDLITKRAVSLGAMYYLIKPFEMKVLIDRMQQLFTGSQLLKQSQQVLQLDHIESNIMEEVSLIGVPMHVKGYKYILEAIKMAISDSDATLKITKKIYPAIASINNTTPTSVERAIRNAIDITITRGDRDFLYEYFNHEIFNDKITNKEFVLRIANAVKRNI